MYEQSGDRWDLVPCPSCGDGSGLRVRWYPEIVGAERTEVGCLGCGRWFAGKESQWPMYRWNKYAAEGWASRGIEVERRELYGLLAQEADADEALLGVREAVNRHVNRDVEQKCPFKVGDRIRGHKWLRGDWSVTSVRMVYDRAKGPFWILEVVNVLPSGRLGDHGRKIFQEHNSYIKALPPFHRPARWCQVVAGDPCLLDGTPAIVRSVDRKARVFTVDVQGLLVTGHHLARIEVPVARVES